MPQSGRTPISAELILRLQTTAGNRAVQRLMDRRRAAEAPEVVPKLPPKPRRPYAWTALGATVGAAGGAALWLNNPGAAPLAALLPFAAGAAAWVICQRLPIRR